MKQRHARKQRQPDPTLVKGKCHLYIGNKHQFQYSIVQVGDVRKHRVIYLQKQRIY